MDGLDPSDIREKALNGQLDLKFPFDFPRKYIPVVEECRNPDPRLRPDMDRVIELITS